MTRPFLTEGECRVQATHPKSTESVAVTVPLLQQQHQQQHQQQQQQNIMFTPGRAKFSRFEVLPPVMCTRRVYVQVAFLLLVALIIFLVRMMSAMRGTFVHYHLESDTDGELVILPSQFAKQRGALCLDGSPPAYYYRQSEVPAVRFWIIHLQSGGWCTTAKECLERSESALGSSLKTEMLMPLEGVMSSDCTTNPDFCLWHMVDLLYCDGGSYLGNKSEPVEIDSKKLYMRGALVFDALIEYLATFTLLKDAEQIIFAGSSAGSIGALVHADRLRARLPSSVKTVHLLVDGGLFVDVPDINSDHSMAVMLKDVFSFHHLHNFEGMKECTHIMSEEEKFLCVLPEVFHKYVFTPIFFINSLYDTWFRKNALQIDCTIDLCSDMNLKEVINTRIKILKEGQEILRSKKNGVFFTSCPCHTVLMKKKFFTVTSKKVTVQQALGAWINHQGNSRNLTEVLEVTDALRICPSLIL